MRDRGAQVLRPDGLSDAMGAAARSVLIIARDLGRGWRSAQRWYDHEDRVARPSIDPGLEEDKPGCSVVLLLGEPDGVKIDVASHLLEHEDGDTRMSLRCAAAVFPAEKNARRRFAAYETALRGCADEMRYAMQSWAMPRGSEAQSIRSRPISLPIDGTGVQTITSWGSNRRYFDQRDVIIRRGRIIAGFSLHGLVSSTLELDVGSLAELLKRRAEAAATALGPPSARIPVVVPVPELNVTAKNALTTLRDYPVEWRDHAVAQYGYDSGTAVYPGSLLIRLPTLRPSRGMVGRAAAPTLHVGWSTYIGQYVAVYQTEAGAKRAARAATREMADAAESLKHRRRRDLVVRELEAPDLGPEVHPILRTKTWTMKRTKSHPSMDVVSTDAALIARRGRMVATYAFTAKGEDIETVLRFLRLVVRKLERAQRSLPRQVRTTPTRSRRVTSA